MLRREAIVPGPNALFWTLVLTVPVPALLMVGAPTPETVRVRTNHPRVPGTAAPPRPSAESTPSPTPGPDPLPADAALSFVVRLGDESYLVLGPAPDGLACGPPRLVGERAAPDGAIAPLATVPELASPWLGREVVVDGDCTATVGGEVAVLSLLSGDPAYLVGLRDDASDAELTRAVFEQGNRVLAARLAGACEGSTARGAWLVPVTAAEELDAPVLREQAIAALRASPAAAAAERAWQESGHDGHWWDPELAELDARVLRHPRTGRTIVSVHAVADLGCGGANIDLWARFSVDAAGELVEERIDALEDIARIERAIDVDGDGTLEYLATRTLGARVLLGARGQVLRELEIPFVGCPC